MVTARLGRIEDKFFRLIPKALAFKPIDDIKDFVYSYVLDEKEVNIDVLRENVRTYQDMERTLDNVKKRMKKLKKIRKKQKLSLIICFCIITRIRIFCLIRPRISITNYSVLWTMLRVS